MCTVKKARKIHFSNQFIRKGIMREEGGGRKDREGRRGNGRGFRGKKEEKRKGREGGERGEAGLKL